MRRRTDIARWRITGGERDHHRKKHQDGKPQLVKHGRRVVRGARHAEIEQNRRQQRVDEAAGGIRHAAKAEQLGALLVVGGELAPPGHVRHFMHRVADIEEDRPAGEIGDAGARRDAE